ncbi:hypothetical protein [Dysgonomonas sp. 511]|uniref:hypothetical protein n=1 Tax=Dysgonomonas sp. 511 TaxID=2302930 RepID=UPI0013D025D7|nr:hypothetical protein [Dysgonomonas sp. 511]NDV79534.1 hypothetical protein [Dysgonomonas sp. 511]
MNINNKRVTLKKTIDVRNTLLAIQTSCSAVIKTKDISANRIRAMVSRLNKEGYEYQTSEKGFVDEIKVSRYK